MGRAAYKCSVIGCTSKGAVSSHRFPNPRTFLEMFQKWIIVLGSERFENIDPHVIYEKFRICSLHFNVDDISPGTKTLKRNVLPHLNMFEIVPTDVNVVSPSLNGQQCALTVESTTTCNISPNIEKSPSVSYDDFNLSGIGLLDESETQTLDHTSSAISKSHSYELIFDAHESRPAIDSNIAGSKTKAPSSGILHKMGINRASKLTPKCKSLYANALLLQKQLRREHKKCNTFKQRLKAASNHLHCQTTQQMTTAAHIFTKLQFRETKMKPKGRRFTLNEKLMSLSLYKQSPKSYRLLSKMFVLPCRKTLSNMLAFIPINTGIDPTLMKVLKENVKNLKPKYRFCSILFDEISLNAGLQYNSNEGTIYGFEENSSGRTQQFADHSLVFMVRGIVKNFKQPICYSFCKSTTNRHDLAHQIREVIKAVQSTGLKVISTICDQGATNSAAINILINDTKAYYWKNNKEYNGDFYEVEYKFGNSTELIKIFHLFDPPHLLKGIRNNLLTKNVSFDMDGEKVASWRDIMNLYELDSGIPDVKMLPRLTKEHVVPNEIRKMKVRNAAQVLSQRVSSIMAFLASKNLIGETAGDTAKFCLFFDKLFDSVNSNYDKVVDGKIYRAGLKKNSPHHQLWKDSLKILSTMRFLSPSTGKPSTPQPPTLKNWIKTIKSFQNIFQVLSDKGIQVLLLRHFNQDSLENFFGALRALGYRNNNPTCEMFSSAYKTLLLNNIMSTHSPGSNCEDDFSEACLVSYQTLFATFNSKLDTDEPEFDRQRVADLPKEENPSCTSDLTLLESQTKNFIAGFIVKKLNTIFFKNCDVCLKEICSNINNDHQIIQARDYQPNGKHLLKYPNSSFCMLVQNVINIISHNLPSLCHHKTLKVDLINIIEEKVDLKYITCPDHKLIFPEKFVNFVVKLMVHNWCTQINRILSGKINLNKNESDKIKINAFERYKLFSKKKRSS